MAQVERLLARLCEKVDELAGRPLVESTTICSHVLVRSMSLSPATLCNCGHCLSCAHALHAMV